MLSKIIHLESNQRGPGTAACGLMRPGEGLTHFDDVVTCVKCLVMVREGRGTGARFSPTGESVAGAKPPLPRPVYARKRPPGSSWRRWFQVTTHKCGGPDDDCWAADLRLIDDIEAGVRLGRIRGEYGLTEEEARKKAEFHARRLAKIVNACVRWENR
jgi:hypothetical protein